MKSKAGAHKMAVMPHTVDAPPSESSPTPVCSFFCAAKGRRTKGLGCASLGTIHFRGRPLRQVSCYTLPGGFQPSWPPPCYLEQATPFMVSEDELALGHPCVHDRSIPRRQYCLPVLAHTEPRHLDLIRRQPDPQAMAVPQAPLCSCSSNRVGVCNRRSRQPQGSITCPFAV